MNFLFFTIAMKRRFTTEIWSVILISLEINLRFRGFVVTNWNVPFTVEDFHESKQSVMRWF